MKLPATSGKKLIKAFEKSGFYVKRQKGSHVRLEKVSGGEIIKITVPLHKSLKKGTLKKIINDSKVKLAEIVKYLLVLE